MPYLCLKCFNTYSDFVGNGRDIFSIKYDDNKEWISCPNTKCVGQIIEVDELMLPIIKILNQKGYYTKFCCSGHSYNEVSQCYIMFEKDIELSNAPNGYFFEKFTSGINKDCIIIEKIFEGSEYKIFKDINKNANQLLMWVKKLKNINK